MKSPLEKLIEYLDNNKDAKIFYIDSVNCSVNNYVDTDRHEETFEEYCKRKSQLGSIYGSTGNKEVHNEKED